MSGEIPPELGSLSNLPELYLEDNNLSGEIPAELGSLSNLTDLYLSNNELSGEIPPELGNLSNLTFLYLSDNDLSGCVPSSLEDQLDFVTLTLAACPSAEAPRPQPGTDGISPRRRSQRVLAMAPIRTEVEKMIRTHTTRYVTLLSVVLALALTAALAACGSDEPSGVTGPDRTASTPTETLAWTPTTPGSGDAPTATDAPEPAAATAPPAASGSVETDREALVALYNATNGENWNGIDNWLSDAPLDEWDGVTPTTTGAL